MDQEIKDLIIKEVRSHSYGLDNYHLLEISDAIYKQLLEYMDENEMRRLIETLRPEFVNVVDILIPLVKEYEEKIGVILNRHVGNIMRKIGK